MTQMNLFTKQKETHIENKLKGKFGFGEGIKQEFGMNRYTLLYIKQTTRAYCIA